jgi:homoserine kinase type II
MAVFTPVSLNDLTYWIAQFQLGKALDIKGIASGIENSNFFITTESGEYVLTVFEKLGFEQLPFYLNLMRHLSQRGILLPAPIANVRGEILHALHGKPATIVTKLEGDWLRTPSPAHCAVVGAMLAKMHLAAQDFPMVQPNLRGLDWWNATTPVVLPFLPDDGQHLLRAEMHFQETFATSGPCHRLPRGPIHADLFRINVMFDGDRLTGFFDFYFACCDTWLFDVAVAANDWCIDLDSGALDEAKLRALLGAYHAVRPFTDDEQTAWQPMLRAASLRFWLSRLHDLHLPRDAQILTPHDPAPFERILQHRISHPAPKLF